jgi:hypothetical protein
VSRGGAGRGSGLGHSHHRLAQVSPRQQVDQPLRRLQQAVHHVLPRVHLAFLDPAAHALAKAPQVFEALAVVVEHDEALHANALLQHGGQQRGPLVR